MKYCLLIILIMSAIAKSHSQSFCNGLNAVRYYFNDTIVVKCDTVYLLNKTTYSFYKDHLKKINLADPKLKELVITQNQLIKLYEERIDEQNKEYKKVRDNFDETLGTSQKFIQSSQIELTGIKDSLTNARVNINLARTDITEVKNILQTEVKKAKIDKWKWGIGGFVLGAAVILLKGSN